MTGRSGAIDEALLKAGVKPDDVGIVHYALRYPATPEDVMGMISKLPGERGLRGIRADYVHLYNEFFENSCGFYTSGFSFQFPEERLEPDGCDTDLLLALAGGNLERLAALVTTSITRSVNASNSELKLQLLRRVGQLLLDQGTPPSQSEGGAG